MSSDEVSLQKVESPLEDEALSVNESPSSESFEFGDFHENLAEISPEIPSDVCLPSIDYDDWSSIMSKVPEIVDAIFGPETSSPNASPEHGSSTDEDESSSNPFPKHFSESGAALWEKYIEQRGFEPLSWEESHIRRMFFVSLEIPLNLDNVFPANKKAKSDNSVPFTKITSSSLLKDSALKDKVTEKDDSISPEIDTQMTRFLYFKSDEALANLSILMLKSHLLELEIILEKSDKYLTYWIKQKEAIEKDKRVFEKVIESLVEHTKRQRLEHIKKTHNLMKKK